MPHRLVSTAPRRTILLLALALFLLVTWLNARHPPAAATAPATAAAETPPPIFVPDFAVPVGRMRAPLPYRIISFHRGGEGAQTRSLIKLAAQLGFNGVQFQIEGSNVRGIQTFADRDAKEHLVDYCHSLGLKVTVWVHELSELPPVWSADYLGPVSATNEKLFRFLEARYETMLTKTLPSVDGFVLTVVETQIRATDTQVMLRLANLLAAKCKQHQKSLIVRTFVWTPGEYDTVMAAINQLPPDTVIMSKVVPQDWQMRGANAPEIGAVGGRPQIVEYDACGEYFLKSSVANCMVDLLKRQFDYGLSKDVQGICVRADRDDDSVLFEPSEVNLWALGLMAAGVTDKPDDVWSMWATYRYGAGAAPQVIRALKPTAEVVAEIVSIGPFTFGDTRRLPPLPDDEDIFLTNWQNWRWDASYVPAYWAADRGDAAFINQVAAQKQAAMRLADESLQNLEAARSRLSPVEYMILYTKLLTNKTQLACHGPMELAALEYHAMINSRTAGQRKAMSEAIGRNIEQVRAVAATLGNPAMEVDYLGRKWKLGVPENLWEGDLEDWADEAESVLAGEHVPHSSMKGKARN